MDALSPISCVSPYVFIYILCDILCNKSVNIASFEGCLRALDKGKGRVMGVMMIAGMPETQLKPTLVAANYHLW